MPFGNVKSKPAREPMARPVYPRTRVDEMTGTLHVELENTTTSLSLHYTTISDGVRLVYNGDGKLIGFDIASRP